jgi:signal peptidase II
LLGDSIRFQLVYNKGAFLSFGASLPAAWRTAFFSFGVGIILLVLLGYAVLSRSTSACYIFALALLCAGGIGNLIDRLRYGGYVVDFLNIGIGSLRSGIFNVADIAVVFGVLVFVVMRIIEHSTPSVRPSL